MAKEKKEKKKSEQEVADSLLDDNLYIYEEMEKEGVSITDIDSANPDEISDWISTGSLVFDAKITNSYIDENGNFRGGIGGGRIVILSGEESTGKSIVAAHIIKEAQKKNAICMYIDGEQAVLKSFFESVGVDFSKQKLIYSEENVVEKNFTAIEKMMTKIAESKNPQRLGLVVWDSIASTTTLKELEAEYGEASYGHLAKQMSEGFRKINRFLRKNNICIVFTNQLRYKMNVKNPYEDPWVEPGGKAAPFYASLHLRLMKPAKSDRILNAKGQQIGTKVKVRFKKNRFGPPQSDFDLHLFYGRGIDDDVNIFYYFKDKKLITTRTDTATIKIPGIDEAKIKMTDWKKWLHEDAEREKQIRKYIIDDIRIDLNSDEFYSEDEMTTEDMLKMIEDSEESKSLTEQLNSESVS